MQLARRTVLAHKTVSRRSPIHFLGGRSTRVSRHTNEWPLIASSSQCILCAMKRVRRREAHTRPRSLSTASYVKDSHEKEGSSDDVRAEARAVGGEAKAGGGAAAGCVDATAMPHRDAGGSSSGKPVWRELKLPGRGGVAELSPYATFANGQCFGWRPTDTWSDGGDARAPAAAAAAVAGGATEEAASEGAATSSGGGGAPVADVVATEFSGVVGRSVVAVAVPPTTHGSESKAWWAAIAGDEATEAVEARLRDLLQLDVAMEPLLRRWASADERMAALGDAVPGLRILRQEPVECLFSFIASSNNHISRIAGMLQRLRARYGERIGRVNLPRAGTASATKGDVDDEWEAFSFPTVEALAAAQESDLRALGFGYRARFVVGTARKLAERGGDAWLKSLRGRPRLEVQAALCELDGVGRKVADCVALFSLDARGSVPVDTHVWAIAVRDFDPTLKDSKSLTPKVYERVGDLFRERYGEHAGWAHSLLFAAELPAFRSLLPAEEVARMYAARRVEVAAKQELREAKRRRKEEREAKR